MCSHRQYRKLHFVHWLKLVPVLIGSLFLTNCAAVILGATGLYYGGLITVAAVSSSHESKRASLFEETIQPVSGEQSLELQAIQTQTFDAPLGDTGIATLNTLTDLGINFETNTLGTGLTVVGEGTITYNDFDIGVRVSVLVSEVLADQSRVRISLVVEGGDANGATIGNPAIYNMLFDRISHNLFTEDVL